MSYQSSRRSYIVAHVPDLVRYGSKPREIKDPALLENQCQFAQL